MQIDKAMELIYNIIHEQSESLTSDQLEALNLGLSALKTVADFKLNFSQLATDHVSRETILGRKLLEVTKFQCDGIRCVNCQYFDSAYGCTSQFAGRLVYQLEKETKA